MQIRPAILADAKGIASVHVDSERAAYQGILPAIVLDSLSVEKQEASWRERIANGTSSTFVADENGDILGWINFGQSRDKDGRPTTGEVLAMYVSPQKWRRGVGNALWEYARTSLQEAGYSDVTLWVFELNYSARQFYEKIGFTLDREIQKTVERGSKTFNVVRYRYPGPFHT
jgi:ribosomal protein S18 acetylase RimI-like enzyme